MRVRDIVGWLAAWCAAIGLTGVSGCGGGVGSGGTGLSAGLAQGTVNGFGSVIVDGERFDDSQVAIFAETVPGVLTQTEVLLGERVEVEVDAGEVRRLQVDAALVGAVEAVQPPGGFTLLGQAVDVNADAARGPVTQFGGGYSGLASVRPGDAVAVHGLIVRNASGFSIRATRVERRAELPRFLKLTGLTGAVDATGFRLGTLRVDTGAAVLLPAGHVLAEGERVAVLAPADSLVGASGAATLVRAAQVRVRGLGEQPGAELTLSGVVGLLDASGRRFDLGGTPVQYADAAVQPETSALVEGRYVQVRGTLQSDGSVRATELRVRDGRSEVEAELKGNVDGLDAPTLRFSVRGVAVDAARAEIEGCDGTLADGQYVAVEGALGPTGVIAKSVHCEDEPDDATVERKGVAGKVDAAAASFVLTPTSGAPIPVRWTDLTYFENVTAATLAGQRVEVEGRLVDGVLVAKKVELESDD